MENLLKAKRPFMVIGACLAWFALIFQFYLILANRQASVPETVIRYFTFFTILSNLLAAVCFTYLLFSPLSRWGRFFSAPPNLTAITTYIVLVGIVYNIILRMLWNPRGLQKLVDELLHTVNPLLFLLFWIFFVSKSGLRWKAVFGWLIFPILYVVVVLLRGAFSGYYPYPFVDVRNLGYPKVFLNTSILIFVFFLISLFLVWVGKWRTR
ncbi:MAG: Pr6Pr family membrane protein [Bacteroidota bacterium]|nr:Pr6Pr family membrane protein [Bacteroidota bacterium]MDP4250620.1 Pr6Pr family membrane protein [Bacteroidota bacterium]